MLVAARADTPTDRSANSSPTDSYNDPTESLYDEEEPEELAFLFDRFRPIQQCLPHPGSLNAYLGRPIQAPTPPLARPEPVSSTGVDLAALSNQPNSAEDEARKKQRLLEPTAIIATEKYQLPEEANFWLNHGTGTFRNFISAKSIWQPSLYYETKLQAAIKEQLTKSQPTLDRLGITQEKFSRVLLTVAHFSTLASADYDSEVLCKPGTHPESLFNVWPEKDHRDVSFAELLEVLVGNSVQVHEELRAGTYVSHGHAYGVGYDEPLPVSDFKVSASLLLVALNFLSQVGILHVSIGRVLEGHRGISCDTYDCEYLLKLAVLDSIAAKQPVGPTYRYAELPTGRTLFFGVVWEYDYAWYGLLKATLSTYVTDTYSKAGFNQEAFGRTFVYQWHPQREPYWCPVLLRPTYTAHTQGTA